MLKYQMEAFKLPNNPREKASIFSQITFFYTFKLFRKGYSKILNLDDLYCPLNEDQSKLLGNKLESTWLSQLNNSRKPSLLKAVFAAFWKRFIVLSVLSFICDVVLRLIQPYLLRNFLLYFAKDSYISHSTALHYAAGIVLTSAISTIATNQQTIFVYHDAMKVRVAVCRLMYKKILKISQTAFGEASTGKIVNLMSNDVNRFESMLKFGNALWYSPILTIVVGYLLWLEVRWAGLIGMAIVFIIVPIQSYSSKLASRYRYHTAIRTDDRVRFMDEIISGIQVIKMYAWEKPFTHLTSFARQLELKYVQKSSYVRALYMTFMLFTTRMAMFCTMLAIVLLYDRDQFTAAKIFTTSAYFQLVSQATSQMFVRGLSEVAEALVAFRRLESFLTVEDKTDIPQITRSDSGIDGDDDDKIYNEKIRLIENEIDPIVDDVAVSIQHATARWISIASDEEKPKFVRQKSTALFENGVWRVPTLENINADFPKGKLIGIIGPVGEGKSSFLQALLRELPLESGSIRINGTISYACQEPWVFAGTVRENILFGQEMDRMRYDAVVKSCALEKDFQLLPHGDRTIINERGQSLSGGQRARVNLARAVYRMADVYLLDDPLSAVDPHVGRHLFKECIGPRGRLACQNATRILVTHQVHFLKDADWLVVLRNGKIEVQGSPGDLYRSGVDFVDFIDPDAEKKDESIIDPDVVVRRPIRNVSKVTLRSVSSLSLYSEYDEFGSKNEFDTDSVESNHVFEESSKDTVKGSLMWKYFKAGGHPFELFMIFILFALAQTATSASDHWMSYWTHQEENRISKLKQANTTTSIELAEAKDVLETNYCIIVFAALLLSIFVVALTRSVTFYNVCIKSSKRLHDTLFNSIISTKMQFFNVNPSGRILNRFAKDIGLIDEYLSRTLLDSIHTNLYMLGCVVLTVIVNPLFLIPIAFLGFIFLFLRKVYLKTSKNLKRLEGIARSPLFTHISVTLDGLSTIRSSHAENILTHEFDNYQDIHSACWFLFISTSSAFGMMLDVLCLIFISTVTFSFLLIDSVVSGDKVGLAITQAMSLAGLLQWGIRHSVEVTNQLMSVERVLEYCNLESEIVPEKPREVPKVWPTDGRIEFKNVIYQYSYDMQPVLRGVTFLVKPKEKIGIVGRTGAGKSSLIGALFRLAIVKGEILIDGIDTATIELKDLRSRIAIIPQDPVLFSGTLRMNLDPFGEYSDGDIWKALQEVKLKDMTGTWIGLDTNISTHGSNFSVGQRQLICLARAILRKNKILVLDEATANVDPQTDAQIQHTIRRKFADCTVLTVAHRLNTIIDSDRVLVMDAGIAVEFDSPYSLLKRSTGVFREMVFQLDFPEVDRLVKAADNRQQQNNINNHSNENINVINS